VVREHTPEERVVPRRRLPVHGADRFRR
jgi:hypothetical protein